MERLDSPYIPLGITAAAYLLLLIVVLNRHAWDPSYLLLAGEEFVDPKEMPATIAVLPNTTGYDGQFYYRLALDPFTAAQTGFGLRLDNPPYRQQRLLYPILIRVFSLGRPHWVPTTMIWVNYLALCALAWIGARFAQSVHRHALWGVVFPGYAGFVYTMTRDLAEILVALLLLAALWSFRRGRLRTSALLLTLSVLTKETALLVAVGGLCGQLVETWRGRRPRPVEWLTFLLPLLVWTLWQLALLERWGELPVVAGRGNLGVPFVGFVAFLESVSDLATPAKRLWFAELCFIIGFALAVLHVLPDSNAPKHETISWLLYLALAISLTPSVWVEDAAYLRALTEFYLLGMAVLLSSESWLTLVIVSWAMAISSLVFRSALLTY